VLTLPEKIIFIVAVLAALYIAVRAGERIIRIVGRGYGTVDWGIVPGRIIEVVLKTVSFQPVFRFRPLPSLFHAFIGWAFIFYLLVNLGDVLEGLIADFEFRPAICGGIGGNGCADHPPLRDETRCINHPVRCTALR
jgi:hypothetical protein